MTTAIENSISHIAPDFSSHNIYDLMKHPIVYKYYDVFKYRHKLYHYFFSSVERKCKGMVEKGTIHSEFYFVRKLNEEKFASLIDEYRELYDEDMNENDSYRLKDSMVKFISLEERVVEFVYKKDIELPQNVVDNPLKLRQHLISLAQWHFKRNFRFVILSFPHMNIKFSGTNMKYMRYSIQKEIPLFNKNIFKGFLNYSKNMTALNNKYSLCLKEIEARNIYQAVKNLDTSSIGVYIESRNQDNEANHQFNFLDQSYSYHKKQTYYNLFQKVKVDKQSFLLTKKALNISYSLGFHYVSQLSIVMDYLHKNLTYKEFSNIRQFVSDKMKQTDYEYIIDDIEKYIMKRSVLRNKLITVKIESDFDFIFAEDEDLVF